MKKTLLFLSLIVNIVLAKAQSRYTFDNYGWSNILYHANLNKPNFSSIDSFALANKIYQIKKSHTYFSKKGKPSYSSELINFDSKGRSNVRVSSDDTGYKQSIYLIAHRNYNTEGTLISSDYKSKYIARTEFYDYNDSNKIIKSTYFDKKNKYSGQTKITYNDKGKESNVTYLNDKNKLRRAYDYYYYPNGQLKQTVLKDNKGKVKRVTDYSCDDLGKSVQKLKDTAKICSIKSYLPNGSIVTTTNGFNYKGKPYKTVEIQDSLHQILKYELYLGVNEELQYSTSYSYSNGKLIKTELHNQSNKKRPYVRITENDQAGRIIKDEFTYQLSKSKNEKWTNKYIYNNAGMITLEQSFKNGHLISESRFSYTFHK